MTCLFKSALLVLLVSQAVRSQGTTPSLEDIFKGRCLDYSSTKVGGLITISDVNCDDLWNSFSKSFAFKDSCGQNVGNYDALFRSVTQTLPKNKALFWSGTMDFAHKLSSNGQRYVTLEDSLVGFIANGLKWCGQSASPGINYKNCPTYGSCPTEAVNNYWLGASKWFASHAEGEVRVVLNGSDPNRRAYRKESIFASLEVLNLRNDLVTKVTAFVVHSLDKPLVESCGTLSLLDMRSDVLARNIAFECLDNPPEVKYLLCLDSPGSAECSPSSAVCADPNHGAGLINTDGSVERRIAMLLALATSLFVKLASN